MPAIPEVNVAQRRLAAERLTKAERTNAILAFVYKKSAGCDDFSLIICIKNDPNYVVNYAGFREILRIKSTKLETK